ncbi:hypothetical protein GCM10009105_01900 [Dokdonella soli]|uniref:Uncharacterized protein n=1 Tax=Dokdonella soli TaxID=529810 RepID=A0ABP3TKR8_9GAMM
MKTSNNRPWQLAAAIATLVAAAGAGSNPVVAGPVLDTGIGPAVGPDDHVVLDGKGRAGALLRAIPRGAACAL